MKVTIKNGPTKNHFSELKIGDVFLLAGDVNSPTDKLPVFMKTTGCAGNNNAVDLRSGDVCFVPAGCIVVKAGAELSVSV